MKILKDVDNYDDDDDNHHRILFTPYIAFMFLNVVDF